MKLLLDDASSVTFPSLTAWWPNRTWCLSTVPYSCLFERAAANTKLLILKQARWRSSHPLADLTDMSSIRRETRR
jgi:hypothetical protein